MRVVVMVVAALLTLGLAAFGVTATQSGAGSASLLALAAHIVSPTQTANTPAPAAPVAAAPAAPVRPVAVAGCPAFRSARAAPAARTPSHLAENTTAAPPPAAAQGPAALPAKAGSTCANPNALGLSRTVEIDTTGGPAFGTEHFKQYDFLREKEVVLTFDDGPWPENTPMVLKALTDNCSKATFFEIGEHATWHPEITKTLIAAGMTVGSHTWSHKDLARNPYAKDIEKAKDEIEMGVSAVHMAAGAPIAPFFRFPDLQQPAT